MAGVKEIRTRITSVQSTMKITSAMKMVSAAKLRKAQNSVLRIRPYSRKMQEILVNLSAGLDSSSENKYAEVKEEGKALVIVITSNGGLCGAFNSNVVKSAVNYIDSELASEKASGNLDIITIGKKAVDLLKSRNYEPVETYDDIFDNLTFEAASELAQSIMDRFAQNEYKKVMLFYNEFLNASTQNLRSVQYLPVETDVEKENMEHHFKHDYIFEPNKEDIINDIIPRSLKTQLYCALLESFASEHGARMTAMHSATDNATELLRTLKIAYNKVRQASITNEILEIVSGANALKG